MAKDHFQGYSRPDRLQPQWYVGYLTFQSGQAHQRTGSLTGGGQIYGHPYSGTFQPVVTTYATPVGALVGGGQIVARPGFLSALFGGNQGNGS
jgi:hypothetical protein